VESGSLRADGEDGGAVGVAVGIEFGLLVGLGAEELLGKIGRENVEVIEVRFPSFFEIGVGTEKRFVSLLDARLVTLGVVSTGVSILGAGSTDNFLLGIAFLGICIFVSVLGENSIFASSGVFPEVDRC